MKSLLTCVSLLLIFNTGRGQSGKFTITDNYVKKLGVLGNFNVATIADTITRPFTAKEEKARAIFYWIATNIALDPKAVKQHDQTNTLPETVVQRRKTTALGFSLLVQEMCSMANIRCLSVDGYIKNSTDEINEKADEANHSWNVVQLGTSPDQWYYVDASKASGFLDKKMTVFTPSFTSEYFFADRTLFNLDHFPDNAAWQMGPGPKSIKEFYSLPVISNAAYELGLGKPKPSAGLIKTASTASVTFSFPYNGQPISSIELIIGDAKKQNKPQPMNFTAANGMVSFSYQFKLADSYPITIMANGKQLLSYNVDVKE